jgi:predicted ArsR family transcriptional regulator
MTEILQCLKKHGQRLDYEIAKEIGMPLALVRQRVAGLAAKGAVITCNLTRFENGKPVQSQLCRVSGYIPPVAPGRKAKPSA